MFLEILYLFPDAVFLTKKVCKQKHPGTTESKNAESRMTPLNDSLQSVEEKDGQVDERRRKSFHCPATHELPLEQQLFGGE